MPLSARQFAVQEVLRRQDRALPHLGGGHAPSVSSVYGASTFSDSVMQAKLPKGVYNKLQDTIRRGQPLDKSIADVVAHAVKEWAIEKHTDRKSVV
jgi:glutamine synthetase type III